MSEGQSIILALKNEAEDVLYHTISLFICFNLLFLQTINLNKNNFDRTGTITLSGYFSSFWKFLLKNAKDKQHLNIHELPYSPSPAKTSSTR